MTRKQANLEIMNELSEYLNKHPDMRLGQALLAIGILESSPIDNNQNIKVKDPFYEEPQKMLERVIKTKKERV